MEIISLPRLRLAQLQTLSESSLTICQPLIVLQPSVEKVKAAQTPFKESMLKIQASATDKNNLDQTRDRLLSGFIKDVKAEQYYPHNDSSVQSAVHNLLKIVNKYGTKLIRLTYNEETAAIDNMMAEMDQTDLSALNGEGLMRWKSLIEVANNNFKVAANDFIEESVDASYIQAASKLAPALIDVLEGLYTMLFAHIKLSADAELTKAYNQIRELVDSYK